MRTSLLSALALVLAIAPNTNADEPVAPRTEPIQITIDAANAGAPINPFIYGQFIEHLGRCIYGGIWAEMLEDRKFFFPITDEYRPYRSLENTDFPVVGASPWEVLGPAGSVTIEKENPFVGEHTPRIAPGSGIRQNDLGTLKGQKHVGYIWVRAPEKPAKLQISLSVVGNDELTTHQFSTSGNEYQRFDFIFSAPADTNQARLEIRVHDAPCLVGAVSLMPANNVRGMRADTLAVLKQLGATMYRWPGGNFVSGYDWRDGIGPRDRRPPRKNPAWTGVEHNDFGIDDFLDFCREVRAEPVIAVNTGFGDDYSAAQQVEYTNAPPDTVGGGWRASHGHPEPYNVKYWCVGNEMWGTWQLGHMQLDHYTQKHNLVARAMHRVDPKLVLIGSGDLGTKATLGDGDNRRELNWSQGMLERSSPHMNLISEHFYCGRLPWTKDAALPIARHAELLRDEIRKKATSHRELQTRLGRAKNDFIPIAMDEWNYWHRDYVYGELGCQYDLADALGVATGLHEYFRNSDIIHMAHYAQTVNVIGCVKTTKTSAFLDSTALPLLLYRHHFGAVPLTVTADLGDSSLDVVAAKTDDGRTLTIGVVNPTDQPRAVRLRLNGAKLGNLATVWRIAGDDPTLVNSAEKQPVAITGPQQQPVTGNWTVPKYSINLYRAPLE